MAQGAIVRNRENPAARMEAVGPLGQKYKRDSNTALCCVLYVRVGVGWGEASRETKFSHFHQCFSWHPSTTSETNWGQKWAHSKALPWGSCRLYRKTLQSHVGAGRDYTAVLSSSALTENICQPPLLVEIQRASLQNGTQRGLGGQEARRGTMRALRPQWQQRQLSSALWFCHESMSPTCKYRSPGPLSILLLTLWSLTYLYKRHKMNI